MRSRRARILPDWAARRTAEINAKVRGLSYMPEIVASTKGAILSREDGRPVHLTGHRSLDYTF